MTRFKAMYCPGCQSTAVEAPAGFTRRRRWFDFFSIRACRGCGLTFDSYAYSDGMRNAVMFGNTFPGFMA